MTSINLNIKTLLESGVHFGHKTMRNNAKMRNYIHSSKNNFSIIDLSKTLPMLINATKVAREVAKNGGRILFVCTKKQTRGIISESAKRCGQYYVENKWLGGMLTNLETISNSIKTLKKLEDTTDKKNFLKKEKLILKRKKEKLSFLFDGIKNMGGYPDLLFIIDTNKESLALSEAKRLNIPTIGIVDTNCNPEIPTYPVPGNDDSIKSIILYCSVISDAILLGVKENMIDCGIDIKQDQELSINDLEKVNLKHNKDSKRKTKSSRRTFDDENSYKRSNKKVTDKNRDSNTYNSKPRNKFNSNATEANSAKQNNKNNNKK